MDFSIQNDNICLSVGALRPCVFHATLVEPAEFKAASGCLPAPSALAFPFPIFRPPLDCILFRIPFSPFGFLTSYRSSCLVAVLGLPAHTVTSQAPCERCCGSLEPGVCSCHPRLSGTLSHSRAKRRRFGRFPACTFCHKPPHTLLLFSFLQLSFQ